MAIKKSEYSKLAIISFIVSLVAIFLILIIWISSRVAFIGFFGSIFFASYFIFGGVILPIVSLYLIKKHNLKGKWLAVVSLILYVCWWIFGLITFFSKDWSI